MSKSPEIWLFSDAAYPGGAEQYLRWILEALSPQRAGLIVVAHEGLAPWTDEMQALGFAVERVEPGGLFAVSLRIGRVIRRVKPRVLHVNLPGPYDGLFATAPFTAKLFGARRVVVTEHLPSVGRVGKRYYLKRACCGAVDVAIALCDAHAVLVTRVFGYPSGRVRVVHNGVPDPKPPFGEFPGGARRSAEEVRLLQVGALDSRKGGDVLLRALAALPDSLPDFRLWFLGEGAERENWSQLAEQLGLSERVDFPGGQADVDAWLAGADIVVLSSEREGMPLSLLEAMAHGRAVVATAVDGVPELIENDATGYLVAPGDADALGERLGRLISDSAERERFGSHARARYMGDFQIERMIQETSAIYGLGAS